MALRTIVKDGGKANLEDYARARREVGFAPENECLFPHVVGVGFVAYAGELVGMRPKDALQRAHEVLDYVGLGEARYRKVESYSTGMKQRLKLGSAIIHDPKLVILDEPTNGMDPAGMAEMRGFIRELGGEGRTVLLSSHLMTEVEQISDRVGVISRGTLVAEGTVDELRGSESLWLRAQPLDEAARIVRGLRGIGEVAQVDGGLRVATDVAAAPEINRALVEAGIAVGELRPQRASLEKVFLELTEEAAA